MSSKADKKRKLEVSSPEKKKTKNVKVPAPAPASESSTSSSASSSSLSSIDTYPNGTEEPFFAPGSAAIPVKHKKLVSRVDVISFFYPSKEDAVKPEKILLSKNEHPKWSLRRDLFIWGLAQMQQKPYSNDPWSFFQIGGIHGLPYQSYDGDNSSEWLKALKDSPKTNKLWWGGYCHHGDVLFPTWHRPYVLLFEHAVIKAAKSYVKQQGLDPKEEAALLEICKELRLPYLDWAGSYVRANGLPDIFTSDQITVNWPTPNTKFNNPLKSFTVPQEVGKVITSGAQYNPFAKPDYAPPPQSATPYTPKGFGTVRYPDNRYISNYDSSQAAMMRGCNLSLRPQVSALFGIADWARFSNHSETQEGSEIVTEGSSSYGTFSSVEVVHDMVHDYLGGAGGHMSYPDVAGLDPIFYFHHCNVDRIIALWQFCYDNKGPEAWLPASGVQSKFQTSGTYYEDPGSALSEDTPLKPFNKKMPNSAAPQWFTSKDVRDVVKDMNVTYPELEMAKKNNWESGDMLKYVLQLYKPMEDTTRRWFVNLSGIPKMEYQGAYSIRVFLNLPTASADTPLNDVHYAGSIYVFARGKFTKCSNCADDSKIRGFVDVTTTMLNLGYVTYPEVNANLSTDPKIRVSISEKDVTLVYVSSDHHTQLPPPKNPPTIVITWQLSLGNVVVKDPSAAKEITTTPLRMNKPHTPGVQMSISASDKGKKKMPWGVQDVHWGLIAKE